MHRSLACFIVCLVFVCSYRLQAQGLLRGRLCVVVADSFGVVPGALLSIDSLKLHVFADASGQVQLFDLNAGNYVLSFHALGYETQQRRVQVFTGDAPVCDTVKLVAINMLAEVNVSAGMESNEARSLNRTRQSLKIVTIQSAKEISKLPVKNAADIAAHLPSVNLFRNKGESSMVSLRGTPNDWTSVMVNGDRLPVACEDNTSRSFEFEAFPADFVDEAIEARSVTPDLESDNIGGSINFVTRPAPDARLLELDAAAGYNFLAKKPTGTFRFLYGDVSRNKKWSFITNGSYYGRNYATDATKVIYGSNYNHSINRLELRRYDGLRVTMGGHACVEFRPAASFKLGMHAFVGRMTDDKQMKKESFNWYEDNGQRLRLQTTMGDLIRQISGGDVYAEWKPAPKWKLNLRAASYLNEFKYGPEPFGNSSDPRNGYFVTEFMSPSLNFTDFSKTDSKGGVISDNASDYIRVKLIGADEPYGKGDDPAKILPHFTQSQSLQASDFQFNQSYTEINHTREQDRLVAQADAEYTVNNRLKAQLGAKYRNKVGFRHISKHEWFQDYSGGNSQPILLSSFDTQLFSTDPKGFLKEQGSSYQSLLYPFLTKASLQQFLVTNAGKLREVEMNKLNYEYYQWVGSNYDYAESQAALYGMLTYSSGKLALLAGMRAEGTSLQESSDTLTSQIAFDPATSTYYAVPERRSVSRSYLGLLPSLNVNYFLTKNSTLRFAASRTMHRPNFEETKPGYAVIRYNDLEYTFGNPSLRPVFSYNVDLAWERYIGSKGLLSVGAYYKEIQDHIFTITTADTDPISGITVKRFANAGRSMVAGLELLFNRRFDFLKGFWSRFGINSNITLSASRMEVPGRPHAQRMSEQTPLLYNVALYYEHGRIETRLSLLYNGRYLAELNLASFGGQGLLHTNSDFDTYVNSFYSLDYQASCRLRKHLSLYIELNNMLNSPERRYIGQTWRSSSTEYYRMRGQLGLKFEL